MAKMPEPKNAGLRIERFDYRVVYQKCGRAKYISHLDLMRAMQRAIKRSKLPIWYTQGFNPHIYIMFPLTLSLGFESRAEVMDFALVENLPFEEVKKRLDEQLPEGMKLLSCARPVHSHTEIASAEYNIRFSADKPPAECMSLFEDFLSRDKIEIEKRTKKKTVNLVDIRPSVNVTRLDCDSRYVYLTAVLPAGGSFNLNANTVIETFMNMYFLTEDEICIERTKIMTDTGENFT